jgi:hypothetical protein
MSDREPRGPTRYRDVVLTSWDRGLSDRELEPTRYRSREKIIGPEYYSKYGNSQVGKGAVDRFKVR